MPQGPDMKPIRTTLLALLAATSLHALAQEAAIRKNLPSKVNQPFNIDEIRKTPIEGLFEVRYNETGIIYTDSEGAYLFDGQLIDLNARINLTEERLEKITAVNFKDLPLKDSFTIVRGNGKRKMAVFEDPNCGYCKKFERDLLKVDNVTVHVFLYPILSADSAEKSKNIWCSKDKGKAFLDWMVRDITPPSANCDTSAIKRNLEFGSRKKITGTPAMFFVDGTRVPGAIGADRIEKFLSEAKP